MTSPPPLLDMDPRTCEMKVTRRQRRGDGKTADTNTTGNIKVIADDRGVQMASGMKTDVDGTEMTLESWMKDGVLYTASTYDGETTRVKLDLGDSLSALEDIARGQLPDLNVSGLALIDSISSQKSGSDTVYTLVMGRADAPLRTDGRRAGLYERGILGHRPFHALG